MDDAEQLKGKIARLTVQFNVHTIIQDGAEHQELTGNTNTVVEFEDGRKVVLSEPAAIVIENVVVGYLNKDTGEVI